MIMLWLKLKLKLNYVALRGTSFQSYTLLPST